MTGTLTSDTVMTDVPGSSNGPADWIEVALAQARVLEEARALAEGLTTENR